MHLGRAGELWIWMETSLWLECCQVKVLHHLLGLQRGRASGMSLKAPWESRPAVGSWLSPAFFPVAKKVFRVPCCTQGCVQASLRACQAPSAAGMGQHQGAAHSPPPKLGYPAALLCVQSYKDQQSGEGMVWDGSSFFPNGVFISLHAPGTWC